MPSILQKCCFFLILLLVACSPSSDPPAFSSRRPDVQGFIQKMVNTHHFETEKLNALFDQVKIRPELLTKVEHPLRNNPWYIYSPHFLSASRIQNGADFWLKHQKILQEIEKKEGVPSSLLVAIIGIESAYGLLQGKYSVMDTLSTLAFYYPKRQTFFQTELEQFLLLSREQHWDPTAILGSYDGGLGQPQFMPSSYRHYAVSFKGNSPPDLFQNMDDITASVAHYLVLNGWQRKGLIAVKARVLKDVDATPLTQNNKVTKPSVTLKEWKTKGIVPAVTRALPLDLKAGLIQIETSPNVFEYWFYFRNFQVITTYNRSHLYALTATFLAEAIEKAHFNRK